MFSSYLKDFDSLLFSNPWLPVKCDAEQCGSACFPYSNIDKSIWREYPVYCRCCVEDGWTHALLFYFHFQFFSPNRIYIFWTIFSAVSVLKKKDVHVQVLIIFLLMNFCLTESHILTCIIECALHIPMLCCAYWNVYCATVVWFCFYCCCISGVYLWSAMSES